MNTKEQPKSIDELIQLMRTLSLSQTRQQLAFDSKYFKYRYDNVCKFFEEASKQIK